MPDFPLQLNSNLLVERRPRLVGRRSSVTIWSMGRKDPLARRAALYMSTSYFNPSSMFMNVSVQRALLLIEPFRLWTFPFNKLWQSIEYFPSFKVALSILDQCVEGHDPDHDTTLQQNLSCSLSFTKKSSHAPDCIFWRIEHRNYGLKTSVVMHRVSAAPVL